MRIFGLPLFYILLNVIFTLGPCSAFLEVIGAIGAGVVAHTYCRWKECCDDRAIPVDFGRLEHNITSKLFGQHLAQEVIVNALRSHWNGRNIQRKALTLSFHGWPGSGKNYVTNMIVDSMFSLGSKSAFVHYFNGILHFPLETRAQHYVGELQSWIRGNTSSCPRQIFIFDEVDKMPIGLLDGIKPFIDYHNRLDGIDFRQTIFIFLSNTGAGLINKHLLEKWVDSGVKREDLKMSDFESLIYNGAFNEEGGFHQSDAIKSNLIDHYVPFLPMERRHVKLCILDSFREHGINPNQIKDSLIEETMEFIEWGPTKEQLYAKTGCKRISQKVGALIYKHRL